MRTCATCSREISDEEFSGYDDRSQREYALSGMCLVPCQDDTFECYGDCCNYVDYDDWEDDD